MPELFSIFSSPGFMPHGHCYLWQPILLYLHIISDSIIALSYYSIPFALVFVVHKRKDIQFSWIYYLFGAFIFLCGTTHLINIWTIWNPDYWLDGWVKGLTALVSIFTAIIIWPLVPKLLKIPSQEQLMNLNNQLQQEISNHKETELMLRKALRNLEDQRYALNASSIVTVADAQGKIIYANDKICEISGYQERELLGKNHSILSSQSHPKSFWRDMYQCVASGKPWRAEVCNKTKDGKLYWVDSTIIAQKSELGKIDRYISIRNDITERKEAEQILDEQRDLLHVNLAEKQAMNLLLELTVCANSEANLIDALGKWLLADQRFSANQLAIYWHNQEQSYLLKFISGFDQLKTAISSQDIETIRAKNNNTLHLPAVVFKQFDQTGFEAQTFHGIEPASN